MLSSTSLTTMALTLRRVIHTQPKMASANVSFQFLFCNKKPYKLTAILVITQMTVPNQERPWRASRMSPVVMRRLFWRQSQSNQWAWPLMPLNHPSSSTPRVSTTNLNAHPPCLTTASLLWAGALKMDKITGLSRTPGALVIFFWSALFLTSVSNIWMSELTPSSFMSDWGNAGYIWMSKDRNNNCGIATAASYPLAWAELFNNRGWT